PLVPASSAANRFLYFSGAWFAILLALGAERAKPVLRGIALVMVVGVSFASVVHQARIWREAARLSRASIDQLRPYAGTTQPLFVTNLPWAFLDGPYVMIPPSVGCYFQGAFPPWRARQMVLRFDRGSAAFAPWTADGDAMSPTPEERTVALELPVWTPEPRPTGALDEPVADSTVSQPFVVRGWA